MASHALRLPDLTPVYFNNGQEINRDFCLFFRKYQFEIFKQFFDQNVKVNFFY